MAFKHPIVTYFGYFGRFRKNVMPVTFLKNLNASTVPYIFSHLTSFYAWKLCWLNEASYVYEWNISLVCISNHRNKKYSLFFHKLAENVMPVTKNGTKQEFPDFKGNHLKSFCILSVFLLWFNLVTINISLQYNLSQEIKK